MAALEELVQAVNANTAEVQRLTAITEKLLALRADAIESVRSAAEAPAKEPKAPAKKTEKPAADAPKADAPAKATEAPKAALEAVSLDTMRGVIAGDVEATDDLMKSIGASYANWGGSEESPVSKEDRVARLKNVKAILDNPKVAAATLAETKPNVRKAVVKKIVEFIEALAPVAAEEVEVDDL
jgi:hypothetical protein